MDIVSPKQSRLLYQTGDRKTRGVIDLRRFDEAPQVPRPQTSGRVFYEIKASQPNRARGPLLAAPAIEKPAAAQIPPAAEPEKLPRPVRTAPAEPQVPLALESDAVAISRLPQFSEAGRLRFKNRQVVGPSRRLNRGVSRLNPPFLRFALSALLVPVLIFSFSFYQLQLEKEGKVLGASTAAYDNLKAAAGFALASDFEKTSAEFSSADANFSAARATIDGIGLGLGEVIGKLPLDTPISAAQNLTAAGENISQTGEELSSILQTLSTALNGQAGLSLSALLPLSGNFTAAAEHLAAAATALQKVDRQYIPEGMQEKVTLSQRTLPAVSGNFTRLAEDYPLLLQMLGQEKEQKYLLLFENNTELRPTGGFIGSYGILDCADGKIKSLTIDGIFNPDGQLKEKVVPPRPLQKVSAAWSLHDSNWFADYPTSAKKAALFYEKTGGPTVDGVIVVTPEVLKKLLALTGPIEMPQYGLIITADNFVAQTQNQVEVLDKGESNPKRILSDLAPLLLGKLFQGEGMSEEMKIERLLGIVRVMEESLSEKHLLVYHRDERIESMLTKRGWAGELVQNQSGDYLAVINTNINGYKTDAMMEESIDLSTEIAADGTVTDTLTIRRRNRGGQEAYDWYNRVNADYLRVYVPKGSVLLSATGHTVEEYQAPLDYQNFKTDPDVAAAESTLRLDESSQTQIFEESGKTVFGNWVYVSPQEEATIVYKYQLPFKVNFQNQSKAADVYSATVQKQPGTLGSAFTAQLRIPEQWQQAWQTENLTGNTLSTRLSRDLIYAAIFTQSR